MTQCTAAICLGQLEIIREQVAQRDKMVRLLSRLIGEIEGVTPLPIPEYMNVYSPWMFGMSIAPQQFTCDAGEFAAQLAEGGIPGAGKGAYYLMPEACIFLEENARKGVYPYSVPPASREYHYGGEVTPRAAAFLENWIRWSTFCEKYTEAHCEMAAAIVGRVADTNRR